MSRWNQFRIVDTYAEKIPETSHEAKVLLDNAWHHLLATGHSLAVRDARLLIHNLFLEYDSIEVKS